MAKIEKLLAGARAHLEDGEEIREAVQGTYETKVMGNESVRSGVLCATDRRILFYAKKLGGYELESFPYRNVSSLEMSKGAVMGSKVSFFASGNHVTMKWISDAGDLARFIEEVRFRMNPPADAAPPAPPPDATSDVIDQLKRLGELKDAGVLTDQEFEAKKTELLGRL